jgi:hypothetical protein
LKFPLLIHSYFLTCHAYLRNNADAYKVVDDDTDHDLYLLTNTLSRTQFKNMI